MLSRFNEVVALMLISAAVFVQLEFWVSGFSTITCQQYESIRGYNSQQYVDAYCWVTAFADSNVPVEIMMILQVIILTYDVISLSKMVYIYLHKSALCL
jgi:protease II